MSYRTKTKYTGVYTRQSAIRKYDGRPDVCFDISYKTPEGKLVYEKVGWRSEGYTAVVASEVRAERIRKSRHPEQFPEPEKPVAAMTFGEAWALFNERWLPNVKSPESERYRYRVHLEPRFGTVALTAITPLMLEDFKHELQGKATQRGDSTLSASTVRLILGDIRRVFRKLTEWEIYTAPLPTARLKLPKADNQRERFLTPKEADRLLGALEIVSCTWWRISMISLYTGMRLGEILGLRGQDIDLANGLIHVDGKTGRRAAYVSEAIRPVLERLMPREPSALLFQTRKGKEVHVKTQSKSFAKAVELVGLNRGVTDRLRRVVFHTLRHTFASWLAQRGVPLYTIGELIGHTTTQMTRRYAKLSPDSKRSAINLIEDVRASIHEF